MNQLGAEYAIHVGLANYVATLIARATDAIIRGFGKIENFKRSRINQAFRARWHAILFVRDDENLRERQIERLVPSKMIAKPDLRNPMRGKNNRYFSQKSSPVRRDVDEFRSVEIVYVLQFQ